MRSRLHPHVVLHCHVLCAPCPRLHPSQGVPAGNSATPLDRACARRAGRGTCCSRNARTLAAKAALAVAASAGSSSASSRPASRRSRSAISSISAGSGASRTPGANAQLAEPADGESPNRLHWHSPGSHALRASGGGGRPQAQAPSWQPSQSMKAGQAHSMAQPHGALSSGRGPGGGARRRRAGARWRPRPAARGAGRRARRRAPPCRPGPGRPRRTPAAQCRPPRCAPAPRPAAVRCISRTGRDKPCARAGPGPAAAGALLRNRLPRRRQSFQRRGVALRGRAHGGVVVREQVLEALDEPARHVARLGRLDRRVHQALAPGHGVEEELGRRQAAVEAGRDKALALRRPARAARRVAAPLARSGHPHPFGAGVRCALYAGS